MMDCSMGGPLDATSWHPFTRRLSNTGRGTQTVADNVPRFRV